MGNVMALSSPPLSWRAKNKVVRLPNPGSFDELHKHCKEVFPQQMEGVKIIINKLLSSHLKVSHTVHMSTIGHSGYHFNAKYVEDEQPSPTETFPMLIGDLDNNGSLNAQILCLLTEQIRSKAVFQTHHSKFLTWQIDGEYRGDDCTATVTLGNPDLLNGSVILVTHFLQSITSRLVLGGELVYHQRMGEEGAILTLAGKYTAQNWLATLNIGYGGAHASYYHKANEQVSLGLNLKPTPDSRRPRLLLATTSISPKPTWFSKGQWTARGAWGQFWRRNCLLCPSLLPLGHS
ncbi:mitochondrial import receptor subunit TOM40B isoform 2-T2 [Rhinophrynus dorsalis]